MKPLIGAWACGHFSSERLNHVFHCRHIQVSASVTHGLAPVHEVWARSLMLPSMPERKINELEDSEIQGAIVVPPCEKWEERMSLWSWGDWLKFSLFSHIFYYLKSNCWTVRVVYAQTYAQLKRGNSEITTGLKSLKTSALTLSSKDRNSSPCSITVSLGTTGVCSEIA